MDTFPQTADTPAENIIYCRYCHRELNELSPYSLKKRIPMCEFCEIKHREFTEIKLLQKKRM